MRSTFELAPDPPALRLALSGWSGPLAVGPVTAGARAHGVDEVVLPGPGPARRHGAGAVRHLTLQHRTLRLADLEVRWQGDLVLQPDGTNTRLTAGERRVLHELLERSPAVVAKRVLAESAPTSTPQRPQRGASGSSSERWPRGSAPCPGVATHRTLEVLPAPAAPPRAALLGPGDDA